jgi:signal transduction histidine kinase
MAKAIFEAKNEMGDLLLNLINIGYNYERMDQLDSALSYQNKAYKLGREIKSNKDIAVVLVNLGDIYHKLQNNDSAISCYRSSIPFALQVSDKQTLANAKYGIAKIFEETGKIDSSIIFTKQSLASSIEVFYSKGIMNASELLSNLYKTQNKMDSAYWYLKISITTKDTMFNAKIVRKVEQINSNEQLRQQEKKAALQRYRSNLIMYALIGGFAILLLAAAFLFRLNQIKREHLIRTKLAKDLHDDLGSTLNSIKVYTNLALIKKEEQHLQHIKESTQEAIGGVRDIIWVMDDHKDNVADLLVRLRQFAIPLCEANGIHYIQQVNDEASSYKLRQEEKKNLYLIIKEAINNTIKYARANEVLLTMSLSSKRKLFIQIKDNGLGFDLMQASEGNGLKNMKFRAEQIGYYFTIDSVINQGTIIELKKH